MKVFKTDESWIVFYGYSCYEKEHLIICTTKEEAEKLANEMKKEYSTLDVYLENKTDYDRTEGYEKQSRIDSGQYADPYEE